MKSISSITLFLKQSENHSLNCFEHLSTPRVNVKTDELEDLYSFTDSVIINVTALLFYHKIELL